MKHFSEEERDERRIFILKVPRNIVNGHTRERLPTRFPINRKIEPSARERGEAREEGEINENQNGGEVPRDPDPHAAFPIRFRMF